jgi:hypothetical protein
VRGGGSLRGLESLDDDGAGGGSGPTMDSRGSEDEEEEEEKGFGDGVRRLSCCWA